MYKTTLEAWHLIDGGGFCGILNNALYDFKSKFTMSILTTSEHERNFYTIAVLNKFIEVAHFRVVVVIPHIDAEFDFLELGLHLVLLLLFFLLFLIVLIFTEIHNPAYGRLGGGRNLHEIQSILVSEPQGFTGFHDAELFAVWIDYADFWHTNTMVNPSLRFPLLSSSILPANLRPPCLRLFLPTLLF